MSPARVVGWLLALAAPLSATDRFAWGRVEVVGPCSQAVWTAPDGGATVLACDLVDGEVRRLTLPFVPATPGGNPVPVARRNGTSWLGWVDRTGPRRWEALPPGLTRRVGPPAAFHRPAPSRACLLLLAAAFVAGLALRRRPLHGAAVALLAGLLLALLPPAGPPVGSHVRVLEGEGGSGQWIAVDAWAGRAVLPAREPLRLETRPQRVPLHWEVRADEPDTWTLRADGATLLLASEYDPGRRRFARGLNAWGTLDTAWLRGPEGTWRWLGTWELGQPLPAAGASRAPSPPGWLAAGLPQGVAVLCGRGTGAAGEAAWVRLVDWRP